MRAQLCQRAIPVCWWGESLLTTNHPGREMVRGSQEEGPVQPVTTSRRYLSLLGCTLSCPLQRKIIAMKMNHCETWKQAKWFTMWVVFGDADTYWSWLDLTSSYDWVCIDLQQPIPSLPSSHKYNGLTGPLEIPLCCFFSRPECGVKQYQLRHKSSFPHLRDVMWTPKSEADPRSGSLCVCMHGCLSNLRWHHPPFITSRGVGPCHLLSSLSTRPQRRKEEQKRERKQEENQQTQMQPGQTKTVWTLPFVADLPHVFVHWAFIKPTICKCYHFAVRQFIKHIQSEKLSTGSLHHQLFNC